jgi:hypothetical protein
MGIGFTIDTPLKVAQYGMSSVISLVDDLLLENLRKVYCGKYQIPYHEITEKTHDFRAKRVTSYLNLLNNLIDQKIEELKSCTIEKSQEIKEYFNMLPDSSHLKQEFKVMTDKYLNMSDIKGWLKENLSCGSIDVNIMTKVDKANYLNGEPLPFEFNDAHAALRGFASSDLRSSIILSAGMNPSLYSYLEQFDDFFPNEKGELKKKIVLKVSDYRSAFIQGKLLAKKGIWVSEYRIESGLNCGGHAFATDGYLMGPILSEFKENRETLIETIHEILINALAEKNRPVPEKRLPLKVTAQGGVGTAEEHQFLIDHYQVDSVGWGTPFLLVPEATSVDNQTMQQLMDAKEEDLYLSGISPLGVPFNNLRANTKDAEKRALIAQGTPGSLCPKKFLVSNSEFTNRKICTASRTYQRLKLKELDSQALPAAEHQKRFDEITEKACICVGLGASSLLVNHLDTSADGPGVSICPGPNMAYFSKKMTLKEITDHIYGRANMITRTDRPNMFIKELTIYLDYLKKKVNETPGPFSRKQSKHFLTFIKNMKEGVNYYNNLFSQTGEKFKEAKSVIFNELANCTATLQNLTVEVEERKE